MKKNLAVFLTILGFLILTALIVFPYGLRKYSIKNSKELLGRQIELNTLRINYFNGSIRITDFLLYEADQISEFIAFDTLKADLKPLSLIKKEFILQHFYLSGLRSHVILEDSTFNFDDLIAYHSSDTINKVVENDSTGNESFKFYLSDIELKNSRLSYENKNVRDTVIIDNFSFTIPYIGWNQEDKSEADLEFKIGDGGYFTSNININPFEGDFNAQFGLYSVNLKNASKHLAHYTNVNDIQGILNTRINILGNINEPEKVRISGNAELSDLRLWDMEQREFLGFERLNLIISEIDYYNSNYFIDSIQMTKPYVYFELIDSTNNLSQAFISEADTPETIDVENDSTEIPDVNYAVNSFIVESGDIDFRDMLTNEVFDYHLTEIQINADSISSKTDFITIYSDMVLNNRGKLVAETTFNPQNPMDMKLNYTIRDFQLTDLNIYSKHFTGFPILYGDMLYKGNTILQNNQLKSDNELTIEHVELGSKSEGIHDLPLKFALFVLEDRNGRINLDIPVRGNLDNPSVSIGKIVWNTLKNLVVKVAAAPYDFMADLIGADPKEIEMLEFAYLDTTLTDHHQKQLNLLIELEDIKEKIEIDLVYFNDTGEEKKQIAVQEAGRIFKVETGEDFKKREKDFSDFLSEKTGIDTLDIQNNSLIFVQESKLDSIANAYEILRVEKIRSYLESAADTTRVKVIISNPKSPKNIGSRPVFEVKYGMVNE